MSVSRPEEMEDADVISVRPEPEKPGKRRWREIENLKELRRLQREIEDINGCYDFDD